MDHIEAGKIVQLTPKMEKRIKKNPLLNLDTFIVPSPYIRDIEMEKDYDHSFVWLVEGEILGYTLVYSDKDKQHFHLYKIVTSPFGRGMGIGTGFLAHLSDCIPKGSTVYLYVWDKLPDTIEYFKAKGFKAGEQIVFRNLIYYYLSASRENIQKKLVTGRSKIRIEVEEIGKTRHDARKTLRVLSDLIEMLTVDNCSKIIEDINRETTSLVNMLNAFRDSMQVMHEVNLRDLILERIVPFVKTSPIACDLQINLNTESPTVLGYHINFSRALINLVSNSLDAIEEAGRKGKIVITLNEKDDRIVLTLKDNGVGICEEMLKKNAEGLPIFVGTTTKGHKTGEGIGTQQIFSTFGRNNINVNSGKSRGCVWTITLARSSALADLPYQRFETRFNEFKNLSPRHEIFSTSKRSEVVSYIWLTRKMEILMFDLILQFSTYHNIRSIYGMVLNYLYGSDSEGQLKESIQSYRTDYDMLKNWLFGITVRIKERFTALEQMVDVTGYQGPLFKSYGQAVENNIIFTMDPETGAFYATDRKLAEHLDFASFLNKPKEELLRGEFKGDVNNVSQPLLLGVWSIDSEDDLHRKLGLLQEGAKKLIEIGVFPDKKLGFYQSTYLRWKYDIDTYRTVTLESFAALSADKLKKFVRPVDDDIPGFIIANY